MEKKSQRAIVQNIGQQVAWIEKLTCEHSSRALKTVKKNSPIYLPLEKSGNLSYSKGLPHDQFGNVNPADAELLRKACAEMDMTTMNGVPMGGSLKLHSPCTSMGHEIFGALKPEFLLGRPADIRSAETGADLVDLYNRLLTRDIPWTEWSTNPAIGQAVDDLNACGAAYGGRKPVTRQNVFRGPAATREAGGFAGVDIGPFVSQFALAPYTTSTIHVTQKFLTPASPNVNYMITPPNYLSCQNGVVLETVDTSNVLPARYLQTPRDGVWSVLADPPNSWAQASILILSQAGCPFGPLNPFAPQAPVVVPRIPNEFNFLDMGIPDCMDLASRAMRLSMNAVWFAKWRMLRLRPENAGYLVHLSKTNQKSTFRDAPDLSPVILDSAVLPRVFAFQNSYLLSQAYPQGAPLHPSMGGGHCTFAAATLTIVKAFFENSFLLDAKVPSPDGQTLIPTGEKVRVDHELNKLMMNVALFRDGGGMHYLSDTANSVYAAESVAVSVLKDAVKRYPFAAGFKFNGLDGQLIVITNFKQFPLLKTPPSHKQHCQKSKE